MRIGRTLPPAVVPISKHNFYQGFKGLLRGYSETDKFRSELKDYFKVKHCFLTSSGKAALTLILKALHRMSPDRDEVLIPAFTCYSVPSAIVRAGLKIRLCDINPETLDYDYTNFQRNLGSKNRLLTVVCQHLFGMPANVTKIIETLNGSGITVLEDTAQAMGNTANNRLLGTIGDIGFFSLGRGKAFSTVEGGIIVTNSDKIAEILAHDIKEIALPSIADHVRLILSALALSTLTNPSIFWLPKSLPGLKLGATTYNPQFIMKRYSPFQAGLSRNWPKRMSLLKTIRRQNVLYWENHLSRFSWLQPMTIGNKSLEKHFPLLRMPVLVQNSSLKNALLKDSEKRGFGIMDTYPNSIDKIEELESEFKNQNFPGAKKCVERLVTFPVHGFLSPKDRQKIIESLKKLEGMNHRSITS